MRLSLEVISSTSRSKDFQPAHQELCLKGSLLQGLCLSASVVTVPGDRLRAGPPPGGAPGGFSVGLPPETLTAPRDPRDPETPLRPPETLATLRHPCDLHPRDLQRPSRPPETLVAPRDPGDLQRPSRPQETLATPRDPRDAETPSRPPETLVAPRDPHDLKRPLWSWRPRETLTSEEDMKRIS